MEHFDRLSKEEKLQELALDEWRNNMIHESIKAGWIKFGEKKGREEGMQKGIKKVVLNMLQEGSKVSFICKVTGLSEDKVKEIKNRLY